MILLDELRIEMTGYRKDIAELGEVLNIKKAQEEVKELQEQATAEDFWSDLENSQKVLQKTKQLENRIAGYEKMQARLEDILTMIEMCMEEEDEDMRAYVPAKKKIQSVHPAEEEAEETRKVEPVTRRRRQARLQVIVGDETHKSAN